MWCLTAIVALAGEHDLQAPPSVTAEGAAIPEGPPLELVQPVIARATRGSTLRLRAGRYPGPLVIDRPMTVVGEPGAVLDGGGRGSVLLVAAPDVTVRDLAVTGGGHLPQGDDAGVVVGGDRVVLERLRVDEVYLGIDLRMASDGVVRDCTVTGDPSAAFGLRGDGIRLWESDANLVTGNTLDHVRDLVVWYSDGNTIVGNTVRGSRYGTHLMHTAGNRIEDNRFEEDVVGVFVMYSERITIRGNTVTGAHGEAGVGMGFKESDTVTVEDNVLADNTTGLYVDSTPRIRDGISTFADNLLAANDIGVRFHGPSHGARFVGNAFVANRVPASSDDRGRQSSASFEGNHWSGYEGYDLDDDGSGDLPYEVRAASGRLLERVPELTYLTGSPALALVDLFVAAFPMFAPEPVLTDAHPLVVAPTREEP